MTDLHPLEPPAVTRVEGATGSGHRAAVGARWWIGAWVVLLVVRFLLYSTVPHDTWVVVDGLFGAGWLLLAIAAYHAGFARGWRARSEDKTEVDHG